MTYIRTLLVIACFLLVPLKAMADEGVGIAAIVNDDIISSLDLDNRIKLVIGTTGLTDSPDARANLRPQILRSLVDEKLQLQEATRNGVRVSDEEMDRAVATIEKQNRQPPGSFDRYLSERGLSKLSFLEQVKAQIAWSKLLNKKVRGKIKISDAEILQNRSRFTAKKKGGSISEVQISAISLPVYSPQNDADARKLAARLSQELSGGASFEAVAAQFTGEGADATQTGAIWVPVSQLDPALAKVLSTSKAGTVTPPVRTASGYQIVKLLNTRSSAPATEALGDAELALKEIVLTLKSDAKSDEVDVLMQIAKLVAKSPGQCSDPGIAGLDSTSMDAVNFDVKMNRALMSTLPSDLRPIVDKLSVGQVSEPFATPQGLHLLMLCERIEIPPSYINKDAARDALFQEKIGLEASKYMRNLRREAFVDLRL